MHVSRSTADRARKGQGSTTQQPESGEEHKGSGVTVKSDLQAIVWDLDCTREWNIIMCFEKQQTSQNDSCCDENGLQERCGNKNQLGGLCNQSSTDDQVGIALSISAVQVRKQQGSGSITKWNAKDSPMSWISAGSFTFQKKLM